ncbi:MAG: hypothetical protein HN764_14445, partial [Gammaproteobacteria bacterium]|nr:hypothetical protein [Gammaproteobacteria bacterium]
MSQIIRTIPLILLVLLILPSSSAFAGSNQALMELLKALQENGTIDAKTYLLVKSVAEQDSASSSVAATTATSIDKKIEKVVEAKVAESNKLNNKVTINTLGKFEVASNDGDFKFRVGGRIQVDGASYAEDASRHNDGTELRRVRLFAQGTLWQYWNYKLQYDFTGSGIDGLQDAYIDY